MNKKIMLLLSFCVVAIVFSIIGYFIGININGENKDKQIVKAAGIYNNKNWNNREATLILNENFTCQYPGGDNNCTWSIKVIEITIQLTPSTISDGKHSAILSDSGIVLHEHFFEKVG